LSIRMFLWYLDLGILPETFCCKFNCLGEICLIYIAGK